MFATNQCQNSDRVLQKKKKDFGYDNHEMISIKEMVSKVYVVALNYFYTIFVIQTVDLALNKV